jgi:plasmid maintenance system antidote protein VapI
MSESSVPANQQLHPGELIRRIIEDDLKLTVPKAARKLAVSEESFDTVLRAPLIILPFMAHRFTRLLGGGDKDWLDTARDYEKWLEDHPDTPVYEAPYYPGMTYKGWSPSGIVDGTMLVGKRLGISDAGWQYVVNILRGAGVGAVPFNFLVALDQAVSVCPSSKYLRHGGS